MLARDIKHLTITINALLAFLLLVLPVGAQNKSGEPPPAAQTELSQRGVSLKSVMVGPQKGLLSNMADMLRSDEYARVLDNLHMTKRGIWTSRGTGITKHRASSFNSGASFNCITPHFSSATQVDLLFQVGDSIYSYVTGTATETSIQSSLSTTALGDIRSFSSDFVAYVNGDSNPLKWTGTGSMSAFSSWPLVNAFGESKTYEKPKYQEVFANRYVTAGFAANPSRVVISASGNPDSYTLTGGATAAGVVTMPAALGPVRGLRTFRLDSTSNDSVLIIGCANGMGLVTGSSALDFAVVEFTREFGLLSNRSWIQLGNDLYFMSTDGIRKLSTNLGISTLAPSTLTFSNNDILKRMNLAQAEKCFVVHHPTTQEVIWFFAIDSDTDPANAIVMNYNSNDLEQPAPMTIVNPLFSTMSGVEVNCGVFADDVLFLGGDNGYLYTGFTGDTFDGSAIEWQFVGNVAGGNSPAQNCSMRQCVVVTEGGDQKFDISTYTLTQDSTDETQWKSRSTKSVDITSSTITKLGTWASGNTTTYPKFISHTPSGSGRYWVVVLDGDSTTDHIDLVGVLCVLTVGGWKQ